MGQLWLAYAELERFEGSMNRCVGNPNFIERFYRTFLDSSPEVARRFEHTNFERQHTMLEDSLRLVLSAARGLEAGRAHLAHIAERHSSRGLNITPELYQLWLDSLVQVAAGIDPKWDSSLDDIWRAALQPCIDRMTRVA